MWDWLTLNWAEDLMYLYTNNKLLWERPSTNPMACYKKNMLSKDSMSQVDESVDENNSLDKDSKTSNELDENEVKHDPLEFPHDDKIPFSRLLFNLTIWQAQGSDIGDANPDMPLLNNDVQVSNASPPCYTCTNDHKSKHVHSINEFHGSGPPN